MGLMGAGTRTWPLLPLLPAAQLWGGTRKAPPSLKALSSGSLLPNDTLVTDLQAGTKGFTGQIQPTDHRLQTPI